MLHEVPPQDGIDTLHLWLHEGWRLSSVPKACSIQRENQIYSKQMFLETLVYNLAAFDSFQHDSFGTCLGKVMGEILLVIGCHRVASSERLLVHASRNQGESSSCMTKVWVVHWTSWFHDQDPSSQFLSVIRP